MNLVPIISHKTPSWQFIPIPKNASTSILVAMYPQLRGLTVEEVHRMKPPATPWDHEGPPTFAVLRNPYRRFVSTWANKVFRIHRKETRLLRTAAGLGVYKGMPLAEFARVVEAHGVDSFDRHLAPQASFLPADEDIQILRFDRIAFDWADLGLSDSFGPLPHMNRSDSDDLDDPLVAKIIERVYQTDCGLYYKRGLT